MKFPICICNLVKETCYGIFIEFFVMIKLPYFLFFQALLIGGGVIGEGVCNKIAT